MKTVKNREEMIAMIGPDGYFTEPVQTVKGVIYEGLTMLVSFKGCTMAVGGSFYNLSSLVSFKDCSMAEGCYFYGLNSLVSFKGCTMAVGCSFSGLESLVSLKDCSMAKDCWFLGLESLVSFEGCTINPGVEFLLNGECLEIPRLVNCTLKAGLELGGCSLLTINDIRSCTIEDNVTLVGFAPV